jgi:putative glutamine amidotransferase
VLIFSTKPNNPRPCLQSWTLKLLVGLLISMVAFPLWAIELYLVEGMGRGPFLIATPSQEAPERFIERWKRAVESHPQYQQIFEGQRLPSLEGVKVQKAELSQVQSAGLLIANRRGDFLPKDHRRDQMKELLGQAVQEVHTLPMGLELVLAAQDLREFHQWIAKNYPVLAALGGADVHPHTYGEPIRGAVDVKSQRDKTEIQLIQRYTAEGRGFLLGICRGAQISAVALGYKLIQDLPSVFAQGGQHRDSVHSIQVHSTRNNFLLRASGKAFNQVNSLHHQAIQYRSGGPLEVAATGEEGVVEALEFKSGKGLLLQFHPEITLLRSKGESRSFARGISHELQRATQLLRAPSCRRVHQ